MNILKERLDLLLVKKGFFQSREKAKRSIMAGIVFVDGQRSDKAGNMIDIDAEIEVKGSSCPYVSRGGLKLEKSIKDFKLRLQNKICMDIGASTGGFTDCMLQNGARKVYSIDVGYGQLDWKLRRNERVINIEKCNVRYLDFDLIKEPIDFISIDVSFISLRLVFPVVVKLLSKEGEMVCLIKPQFEAGRSQVGKKGIVKDMEIHKEVIQKVIEYAKYNGLHPYDISYSPITGAKGNIEFLLYVGKKENLRYNSSNIDDVVRNSHDMLSQ